MKGMQYTFPVAPPAPSAARPKQAVTAPVVTPIEDHEMASADDHRTQPHEIQLPASPIIQPTQPDSSTFPQQHSLHHSGFSSVIRFPALFSSDFSPTALLGHESSGTRMSFGTDIGVHMGHTSSDDDSMFITRPTFEFPLDELMDSPDGQGDSAGEANDVQSASEPTVAPSATAELESFQSPSSSEVDAPIQQQKPDLHRLRMPFTFADAYISTSFQHQPATLSPSSDLLSPLTTITPTPTPPTTTRGRPRSSSKHQRDEDTFTPPSMPARSSRHAHSASVPMISSQVASSFDITPSAASATPSRRNSLKTGRHAAPSATPPPRAQRPNHGNTAPGGVKSECANCGATSTPLWRRGLNDELNCNVSLLAPIQQLM